MSVVRAYLHQLLTGTLYAFLFLGILPLAVVGALLLPSLGNLSAGAGSLPATLSQHRESIYWVMATLAGATLGLFYHALDRIIAAARRGLRPLYQTVTVTYLMLLTYGGAIVLVAALTPQYRHCETYTQKLNGGPRQYRGQQLYVELCGAGSDNDIARRDPVRLRIFDEHGRWRAVRYFTVRWGSDFPLLLEYANDHLIYFDAGREDDIARVLPMPPHLGDWISTHIPLLD